MSQCDEVIATFESHVTDAEKRVAQARDAPKTSDGESSLSAASREPDLAATAFLQELQTHLRELKDHMHNSVLARNYCEAVTSARWLLSRLTEKLTGEGFVPRRQSRITRSSFGDVLELLHSTGPDLAEKQKALSDRFSEETWSTLGEVHKLCNTSSLSDVIVPTNVASSSFWNDTDVECAGEILGLNYSLGQQTYKD